MTARHSNGSARSFAEFWLSAQRAVDLYEASKRISKLPKQLPHLAA